MTKVAYFKDKQDGEITAVFDTNTWKQLNFLDGYAYIGQHTPIDVEYLKECDIIPEDQEPIDVHGNLHKHLVEIIGYDDLIRDNKWILERMNNV